jgi:hypothetical protein
MDAYFSLFFSPSFISGLISQCVSQCVSLFTCMFAFANTALHHAGAKHCVSALWTELIQKTL